MEKKYLHFDDEFDVNGRASRQYPHDDEVFTVEEKRVGNPSGSDATILRVLDGEGDLKVAATYMNGLEDRRKEDYEGLGESVNELEDYDNPLHAINQITYASLDKSGTFAESEGYQLEGVESL